MYKVRMFYKKQELEDYWTFKNLNDANDFLFDKGYYYDSFDEESHLWVLDDHNVATIEEMN